MKQIPAFTPFLHTTPPAHDRPARGILLASQVNPTTTLLPSPPGARNDLVPASFSLAPVSEHPQLPVRRTLQQPVLSLAADNCEEEERPSGAPPGSTSLSGTTIQNSSCRSAPSTSHLTMKDFFDMGRGLLPSRQGSNFSSTSNDCHRQSPMTSNLCPSMSSSSHSTTFLAEDDPRHPNGQPAVEHPVSSLGSATVKLELTSSAVLPTNTRLLDLPTSNEIVLCSISQAPAPLTSSDEVTAAQEPPAHRSRTGGQSDQPAQVQASSLCQHATVLSHASKEHIGGSNTSSLTSADAYTQTPANTDAATAPPNSSISAVGSLSLSSGSQPGRHVTMRNGSTRSREPRREEPLSSLYSAAERSRKSSDRTSSSSVPRSTRSTTARSSRLVNSVVVLPERKTRSGTLFG
jgi:hypothetical protein